jgi:hypothetical protein
MNRRTLIILLVAFVALAFVALFQNRQFPNVTSEATLDPALQPTTNAAQYLSDYKLLGKTIGMTLENISAIRLRDPDTKQTFTLKRDSSGNWTAPDNPGTLDQTAATNIAKTVVLLPYESTIEVKPDTSLADFGFEPDGIFAVEVVLRTNLTHAILIGNLNASGVSYYGLVDDKKVIYIMERRAIDYLLVNLKKPPVN